MYAGNIDQIGRRSDGSRRVMFRSASSTFDTQWPKWAYQIAMTAYLYDKQIQVVADGQPDGDKLLSVNLILPIHPPHQGSQPAHHRPLTSENSTACLDSGAPGRHLSRAAWPLVFLPAISDVPHLAPGGAS